MSAMTYNSLVASMQAASDRGKTGDTVIVNELPAIITRAEQAIAIDLKIQGQEVTVQTTLTAGTSVYPKPDRWRTTLSLTIGKGTSYNTRKTLYTRSYEYLRMYWPDPTQEAEPRFYADHGEQHWLIAATPDLPYPLEAKGFQMPAPISADNQTNYLTESLPTLLFERAMQELSDTLKRADQVARWKQRYAESRASITGEDLKKISDRAAERSNP